MATESSISVVVRVRPFSEKEKIRGVSESDQALDAYRLTSRPFIKSGAANRRVVEVVDDRMLVFDPQSQDSAANQRTLTGRIREQKFVFDRVFDQNASQHNVYAGTVRPLLDTVLDGFNASVFAYGATGCGKTHTISGTPDQRGLIFLTMEDLFARIDALRDVKEASLSLSYLEIYNETLRDLLSDSQSSLALREGSDKRMHVSNLTSHSPASVAEVMELIFRGNEKRTISPTEANAVSSRSHAVLEIVVALSDKLQGLEEHKTYSSLTIIDLAGSERAASSRNKGQRLIEGANINRSLLALGNCINGLCDPRRRSHIPYRDSKLTRLLKFSLGGNCKTVMIACISPSAAHYDETLNTLKYADRAKSIKTKVSRNLLTVDRHVQSYCRKIQQQQQDIALLRAELENLKSVGAHGTSPLVDEAIKRVEAESVSLSQVREGYAAALRHKKAVYVRYERLQNLWRTFSACAPELVLSSTNPRFEAVLEMTRTEYANLETPVADQTLAGSIEQERAMLVRAGVETAVFDASCRAIIANNDSQVAKLAGDPIVETFVEDFLLDLFAEVGVLGKRTEDSAMETPNKRSRVTATTLSLTNKVRSSGKRQRYGDLPPPSPLERDVSMQDLLSPTGKPPRYL